jgi:hypothetical protein
VPPSLTFAIILAITLGLLFHSIFGRRAWQLPCFVFASVLGLLGGQVAGTLAGWDLLRLGNVPLATAVTGALISLCICWFFTAPIQDGNGQLRRAARRAASRRNRVSA